MLTFFYDESINPRKFYLQDEKKFNIDNYKSNFILGGIVLIDRIPDRQKINRELRALLKINPPNCEIKTRVVFTKHSDFIDCLKNKNFTIFINFLIENNFYIHFESLNFLYWAIVDIIDSIPNPKVAQYNRYYKDLLYKFSKRNINAITEIFYKYSFPDVKKELTNQFLLEIINLLKKINNVSKHDKIILSEILNSGIDKELIFINDNEPNILIDSFSTFYENRIKQFPDANHILDEEPYIIEEMKTNPPVDMDNINYSWVDSKTDIFLQISDLFVGLFGKLKTYLNNHSIKRITEDFNNLDNRAKENLKLLSKLFLKNDNESVYWTLNIDADSEIEKINHVLQYIFY